MVTPTPETPEELVDFITEYVGGHFSATGGRTSGAALAHAIRTKYPNLNYDAIGFTKLADAVKSAEKAGKVVRHRDVQHLEVSPSGETPRAPQSRARTSVRIRPEVWRAFVFVADRAEHFLDRKTGAVLHVVPTDQTQTRKLSSSERYIRIEPIDGNHQKQWMRDFLANRSALNGQDAPIDADHWWSEFPVWLREHAGDDPSGPRAWSIFRSRQVAEHVRRWSEQQTIPFESLLMAERSPEYRLPASAPKDNEATRDAVLSAIAEMSYDELIELRLPLRHVLRHFVAR